MKGFDVLMAGYERYRELTGDPWPLTVCGAGPLQRLAESAPGVEYRGFADPAEHVALFAGHGALVLPSRFDPWPLVIVEAAASGLPILCSDNRGSAVELVRDGYNGRVRPLRDADELAAGLRWLHERAECLPTMGRRSAQLAEPYSVQTWAVRWGDILSAAVTHRKQGGSSAA